MAVDDLTTLRSELPDVFRDVSLPSDIFDDYYIIPTDISASLSDFDLEVAEWLDRADLPLGGPGIFLESMDQNVVDAERATVPQCTELGRFPGSPIVPSGSAVPPPDAFAFYLPFHYFFPDWWGIYIVLEGQVFLGRLLINYSGGKLSTQTALRASKAFLYYHEQFHHCVESFATRLEISHRKALYRKGFQNLYDRTLGSDKCIEEALASAYAIQKVKETLDLNKHQAAQVDRALNSYVNDCGPGYRRAPEFLRRKDFVTGRAEFAERNHVESIPSVPSASSTIWQLFSHAFDGFGRVNSRVNYLVRANSELANRMRLRGRFVTSRELIKKLKKLVGLKFLRSGGNHLIYKTVSGSQVEIPHHSVDLKRGTLKGILKEAGVDMSISRFLALKL